MPFLPALAKGVGAAIGIVGGVKSIFGGGSKKATQPFQAFKPPFSSIRTPSFNLALGGAPSLTRRGFQPSELEARLVSDVDSLTGRLRDVLPESIAASRGGIQEGLSRSQLLRSDIASLRESLTPGFGRLSEERQKAIRDARDEAVGNLRESLSRRRVLGSSFADDAVSRTELAFGREAGLAAAETFQQEALLQGNLLALDAEALGQQTQLLALDIGLNEQEARVFSQELESTRVILEVLQTTITRQLQELGISGNIANGLNAIIADALQSSTLAEIEGGRARGEAIANLGPSTTAFTKSLGDLLKSFGGGTGGGTAGAAGAAAGAGAGGGVPIT